MTVYRLHHKNSRFCDKVDIRQRAVYKSNPIRIKNRIRKRFPLKYGTPQTNNKKVNTMKYATLKVAAAVSLLASAGAMAATNPSTAGLSSTGDLNISVTKGELVRVSQLADMVFPPMPTMAADTTLTDDICVFSTTGGYNLTATSPNASATQLRMAAGGNFLNYSLALNDLTVTQGLPHGTPVTGFTGANTTDDLCSGGTTATLEATILSTDFNAVPQGAYTDTVTLTFNPE